jgi:hypothetical protein
MPAAQLKRAGCKPGTRARRRTPAARRGAAGLRRARKEKADIFSQKLTNSPLQTSKPIRHFVKWVIF